MPSDDNVLRLNQHDPGADRRMMMTPDLWPLGAMLALTRPGDPQPELGMMLSVAGVSRTCVFTVSMFDQRLVGLSHGYREQQDEIPRIDYESIDAILEAGWRMD